MKIKKNLIFKFKKKYNTGFSFFEIIISISLLFTISVLVVLLFNSSNDKQLLYKQIDLIKSSINQTRMDAINSKNTSNQSVLFSTTSISYQGKKIDLENNIFLMSYTTATNTIIFSRISGIPNTSGIFTYKIQKGNNIIATSSITINNLGIIE